MVCHPPIADPMEPTIRTTLSNAFAHFKFRSMNRLCLGGLGGGIAVALSVADGSGTDVLIFPISVHIAFYRDDVNIRKYVSVFQRLI